MPNHVPGPEWRRNISGHKILHDQQLNNCLRYDGVFWPDKPGHWGRDTVHGSWGEHEPFSQRWLGQYLIPHLAHKVHKVYEAPVVCNQLSSNVYPIKVQIPNGHFKPNMLTAGHCSQISNPLCLPISHETGGVLTTNPDHGGKGGVVKGKVEWDMLIVTEVLHDLVPGLPVIPGNVLGNHLQHAVDDALSTRIAQCPAALRVNTFTHHNKGEEEEDKPHHDSADLVFPTSPC